MLRCALHRGEKLLFGRVCGRLEEQVKARLWSLLAATGSDENSEPVSFTATKAEPARLQGEGTPHRGGLPWRRFRTEY